MVPRRWRTVRCSGQRPGVVFRAFDADSSYIKHPRPPLAAMKRTSLHRFASLALGAAVVLPAAVASASGIGVARFGGTHGNPTEQNAYSIYYNPAGLAGVESYQLSLDVAWAYRTASYERPESAVDNPEQYDAEGLAANVGEGNVSNLVYSPMVGFATDFRSDIPIGIGAAFFVPFGGQSVWEETATNDAYPGAEDGPNRWYVIEGTIRTLAVAIGAGYEIESAGLSLGLAANMYMNEIDTVRARNAAGTDNLAAEGRSRIDASQTALGIGAGLLWEAVEDQVFVGISYQSAPNMNGELALEGELTNIFPPNDGEPSDIVITHQLPDVIRYGVRFHQDRERTDDNGMPVPHYEVRFSGEISRWERLKNQCIIDADTLGDADPYEFCAVDDTGALIEPGNNVVQNLRRDWQNAFGWRLAGSYWINERVELQLDFGYDSNAIPDETLEPALMDFNKATFGIGGRFALTDFMALALTATEVLYFERDTTDVGTQEESSVPSRQPSSEGVYNQNIFVLNTALEFDF